MRVPFRKTNPPPAVSPEPGLAAEQRRRVIEWGRPEAELERDPTAGDESPDAGQNAAVDESASAG